MGKNWVHIRDGSGSVKGKDYDVALTTQEKAKIDDVVLVSGVVSIDKEIEMGMKYPLLIEDAKLGR
jgi:hypothetical protein